ncbi:hypothetical protein ACFY8P_04425 [Streptomyces sp. NPDC012693]|uniref:hypothetical protein n=1 Tax=Streptomyces sp. NPDC012693 TaxID=3364844 RepID=UPI0036BA159A
MRRLTTAAVVALFLALVGCSSQQSSSPSPAPTTTTAAPTLSAAEQRQACVDAWAATLGARPADFNPETDTDPTPAACNGIPESDSLDAYMDGLMQHNRAGQDELRRQIDEAASADAQTP